MDVKFSRDHCGCWYGMGGAEARVKESQAGSQHRGRETMGFGHTGMQKATSGWHFQSPLRSGSRVDKL